MRCFYPRKSSQPIATQDKLGSMHPTLRLCQRTSTNRNFIWHRIVQNVLKECDGVLGYLTNSSTIFYSGMSQSFTDCLSSPHCLLYQRIKSLSKVKFVMHAHLSSRNGMLLSVMHYVISLPQYGVYLLVTFTTSICRAPTLGSFTPWQSLVTAVMTLSTGSLVTSACLISLQRHGLRSLMSRDSDT
jgi:hypothetical protein